MGDTNHAAVCGLYCPPCDYLHKQCEGCGYMDGKPFWIGQSPWEVCPLYYCCRNLKQQEHCGLCGEFPCKIFLELRDPNMNDDQFQRSIEERGQNLKKRAEIGTDQWLQEKSTD